jgi:hypothetical protein
VLAFVASDAPTWQVVWALSDASLVLIIAVDYESIAPRGTVRWESIEQSVLGQEGDGQREWPWHVRWHIERQGVLQYLPAVLYDASLEMIPDV